MGAKIPKQFLEVDNKPIIIHTIEVFSNHKEIDGIIVVCKEEYIQYCKKCLENFNIKKILSVIPGGCTGQDSIYNGLAFLKDNFSNNKKDIVLIHDGVRPLITSDLISKNIENVKKFGNSVTVSKAIETIIKIDETGKIVETVNRAMCRHAKAPQCFYLDDIIKVHNTARIEGYNELIIDSASLMSFYGHILHTVECGQENIKITTPNDYYMFKAIYEGKK